MASLKVWQNAYIENSEAKWLNDYSQLQPNLPSSKKCRVIFLEEYNEKKIYALLHKLYKVTYTQSGKKQWKDAKLWSLYQMFNLCYRLKKQNKKTVEGARGLARTPLNPSIIMTAIISVIPSLKNSLKLTFICWFFNFCKDRGQLCCLVNIFAEFLWVLTKYCLVFLYSFLSSS